jgi:cellulose synthase/poly-beta-1,6-N-acetylglucosamine synthase-like glycosyltransferase
LAAMADVVFLLWFVCNLLLLIHVLHELVLLVHALRKRSKVIPLPNDVPLPFVTIQLPLFNEKYVVERLLTAVSNLDYPKELVEVQVLDDSTDETSDLIRGFIQNLDGPHFDFQHIRRADRSGFKAGALDYGLKIAKGEFIAIFDADFVPDAQFLQQTLGSFSDPKVGLVQTRWTHLNEYDSILTRAQKIMLNTHFTVEHLGRLNAKGFINFNGTAGVWRKDCINQSGGWQADTLTEDLDLSFRAQMKGWKFKYLFEVGSPAELPVTFDAFRTQQFRWSKGAAECLRKNLGDLWKSKAGMPAKMIGTFHLLNSSIYLLVVGILLLSPAVYYFQKTNALSFPFAEGMSLIGPIVLVSLLLIFYIGDTMASSNKVKSSLFFNPSLLVYFSMTTGISLYMVFGIIEGYRGKKSDFVRTPKFGQGKGVLKRIRLGYNYKKEYSILFLEVLALFYGIFWLFTSLQDFNLMTFVYALIILFGFSLSVFFKDWVF